MTSRSPTVTTPLLKTSSVPQSPIKEATPSPHQLIPFPPPQTFDVLPQLHGLLLRLLSPPTTAEGPPGDVRGGEDGTGAVPSSGLSSAGPGQTQTQQQSLVADTENNNIGRAPPTIPIPSSGAPAATMAAEVAALGPNAPPPLDIKYLPTAASSIKIRIQKAQSVVDGLPDVHRTVEEQEQEIEELEGRIAKLKCAISEFGRRAGT